MNGDLGAAFADFAFEVLSPQYPGLVRFPTLGKDGGIDLGATNGARTVVECKHVGDGDVAHVRARWQRVAERLRRNLADPAGPPRGQSQYEPWYRSDLAIDAYLFCVSRRLPNQRAVDELEDRIRDHFAALAAAHAHLAHLRDLAVRVIDFGALLDMAGRRAHVLYRWFPATRPIGLLPLEEPLSAGGFRAYLSSARLPHYSLRRHREHAAVPGEITLHDEQDLLAILDGGDATGLLITGAGGFGKTRLTGEIGELAHRQGWTVLRALGSVDRASIEQLGETVQPGERTLLLFDYVEVQQGFQDLVALLNDLNDQYDFALRYVANCRRSYYNRLAALPRHARFNLSPLDVESQAPWHRDYRRAVVNHILDHSGLEVTDAHVAVCRETPVLAVFLAYLHEKGRDVELRELLNEQDFVSWVLRRVQLSTGGPLERELAQLMTLFPFAIDAPLRQESRALLEILAADGWIERTPADGGRMLWTTAHDVLADRIVSSHLDRVALTAAQFVDETLACAEHAGHVPSAIASLQRVADVPALAALDWRAVLDARIAAAPDAWRPVRSWLLETALLTPDQQIAMLERHAALWDGAEHLLGFQKQLGRLVRWTFEQEAQTGAPIERRAALERWVARAADVATEANDIVTYGLRLSPERGRDAALRWMRTRAHEFHTHHLLVVWLRLGLPLADAAPHVGTWAEQHGRTQRCGHVLRAWLDADGEIQPVRDRLMTWLAVHGERSDAGPVYGAWLRASGEPSAIAQRLDRWLELHALSEQFSYVCPGLLGAGAHLDRMRPLMEAWLPRHAAAPIARYVLEAWLDGGCDPDAVRGQMATWLQHHGATLEANYLYRAWLDAGGGWETVADALGRWLAEHAEADDADFVYRGWLDAGGSPAMVEADMVRWLGLHATKPGASFLYRSWLDAAGGPEAVADALERWLAEHAEADEADFVYRGWLDADGDPAAVHGPIARWLGRHGLRSDADYIYRAWLRTTQDPDLVRELLPGWLERHGQTPQASYVYSAWLDAGGEPAFVRHHVERWLAEHHGSPAARHVLVAWLRADAELAVVAQYAFAWMQRHRDSFDAGLLVNELVRRHEPLPPGVVEAILTWCTVNPSHHGAVWGLSQLGRTLQLPELSEAVLTAAEAVVGELVRVAEVSPGTASLVPQLLCRLVRHATLDGAERRARVDALVLLWLRHQAAYPAGRRAVGFVQTSAYFQRFVDLVCADAIDFAGADRDAVERFLRWVDGWMPERKRAIAGAIRFLGHTRPAAELWGLVTLEHA